MQHIHGKHLNTELNPWNGFEYEIETSKAELIKNSRLCAITLQGVLFEKLQK